MKNDRVLSQAEIDALLTGSLGDSPGGKGQREAPPRPAPARRGQPQQGAEDVEIALNRMAERLDRLSAAMERVTQLEKSLSETNASVAHLQQEFESVVGQIQLVSSRMEGVLSNLKSTLGYRARSTFVCDSCQASGQVAARVKCTHCGNENWWGWWPQKR